jgi:hypothetical protein
MSLRLSTPIGTAEMPEKPWWAGKIELMNLLSEMDTKTIEFGPALLVVHPYTPLKPPNINRNINHMFIVPLHFSETHQFEEECPSYPPICAIPRHFSESLSLSHLQSYHLANEES